MDGCLLDKETVAARLNVSPRLLADPAWRQKFGLAAVKVGGLIRFEPLEVQRWLEQRREQLGVPA